MIMQFKQSLVLCYLFIYAWPSFAADGYAHHWVYHRTWNWKNVYSPGVSMEKEPMGVSCENGLELIPTQKGFVLRDSSGKDILNQLRCPKFEDSDPSKIDFSCNDVEDHVVLTFEKTTRTIDGGEAGDLKAPGTKIVFNKKTVTSYCSFDLFQADLKPQRIKHSIKLSCSLSDPEKPSCIRSATFVVKGETSPIFKDRISEVKNVVISDKSFMYLNLKPVNSTEGEVQKLTLPITTSISKRFRSSLIVDVTRSRKGVHFDYKNAGVSLSHEIGHGYVHLQHSIAERAAGKYWLNYVATSETDSYGEMCKKTGYRNDDAYLDCQAEIVAQ